MFQSMLLKIWGFLLSIFSILDHLMTKFDPLDRKPILNNGNEFFLFPNYNLITLYWGIADWNGIL